MGAVVALLGPTNTGKTYLALERMLEHPSGMIGFPLRLLARENYDRVVRQRGPAAVALITGEERIAPPGASYFVCTTEAMPLDRRVDFVAVDEVQLAADRERGHVFTDRILHARGRHETMLLGAETVRPILRQLVPEAAFISRPRLSTLRYAEPKKLRHLPRRTAVVAFSLAEVYAVAERLREETGGVALVFGALSPRTRNAQVALYQEGEVDFLVATDAIGMGLNLDIDHVVFTSLTKHDGQGPRRLRPAEVAQIAGRAGRHVKDGTFGGTTDLGPFEPALVDAVENHRFEPLESVFWRNRDLAFTSLAVLQASLERRPSAPSLVRMTQADDHAALEVLARDPDVRRVATGTAAVQLLWGVCQVPDFRNVLTDAHTGLLRLIFGHLVAPAGRLPEDWVAAQVAALDRPEGDVDTLLARIAAIRTWTYVSHRPEWLADPGHWQARTRQVEDRLSDALHERLTEQFVDRRAAVIARADPGELLAQVTDAHELLIQGVRAGRLEGFRFVPDPDLRDSARPLLAAANRALRADVGDRVRALEEDGDERFSLTVGGQVAWREGPVARLVRGENALAPRVEVLPSDLLDVSLRERVRRRLAAFLDAHVRARLAPLVALRDAPLRGRARGIAFAVVEALGSVPRRSMPVPPGDLSRGERRELLTAGVVLGRFTLHVPGILDREAIRLRALLWSLRHGQPIGATPDGRPSLRLDPRLPVGLYAACGYHPLGNRALRVDRLERFAQRAERLAGRGAFALDAELAEIAGCRREELVPLLSALGYVWQEGAGFLPRASSRTGPS